MKILINDLLQFSDLPDELKNPGLDDAYPNSGLISVTFAIPSLYSAFTTVDGILSQPGSYNGGFIDGILAQPGSYNGGFIDGILAQPIAIYGANTFNCIGIGGTDATRLIINGDLIISSGTGNAFLDGLYELPERVTASTMTIEHNGTYLGRIACGECQEMFMSPTRETGHFTSVSTRRSLSGAVIPPAGGYTGRIVGVDFRYKITRDIWTEIDRAYASQISQGFPFFIDFENENWLPFNKFYGQDENEIILQSSVNRFLYSRRFEFREAF